jgi:hypothetical protein
MNATAPAYTEKLKNLINELCPSLMGKNHILKNIRTLAWWAKHEYAAKEYKHLPLGAKVSVPVGDLFPSLNRNNVDASCDFEIPSGYQSRTRETIKAMVCKEYGILIIVDGHHRFNDALNAGSENITVEIVKKDEEAEKIAYRWIAHNADVYYQLAALTREQSIEIGEAFWEWNLSF